MIGKKEEENEAITSRRISHDEDRDLGMGIERGRSAEEKQEMEVYK